MSIDVVIVTYNRLEKLKRALSCYENQTVPFRNLIVVNNNSTDGTTEYLESWKEDDAPFAKHVLNLPENYGGSGGFCRGQEYAMSLKPDWLFLADDDAYASYDMVEEFIKFSRNHNIEEYSAVCGTVYYIDGSINFKHRSCYQIRQHRLYNHILSSAEDYKKEYFPIDYLSYVGSFINTRALRKAGLVDSTYFILYDDSEHSLRLKRYGDIICVPAVKITHDEQPEQATQDDGQISWKDYYYFRNEMHMLKKHHFLSAVHKTRVYALRGGKSESPALRKIHRTAIIDAWLNRLGKHRVYRPGWSMTSS